MFVGVVIARHRLCEIGAVAQDMLVSPTSSRPVRAECVPVQGPAPLWCSRGLCLPNGLRLVHRCEPFVARIAGLQYKSRAAAIGRTQPVLSMSSGVAKTVLVPIGNGSEEMEAVTIIDVLRRAGASVTVASVESKLEVKCSRDVKIVADVLMSEAAKGQYDLVVLAVRVVHSDQYLSCP